jgi:hypothetical protein
MRKYTFWPDRETYRPHFLIPAVTFIVVGALWAIISFLEQIPERGALRELAGTVESVTNIDKENRFYGSHRYDLELKVGDGRVVTKKLVYDILPREEVRNLYKKAVAITVSADNWIMSIASGGNEILSYEKSRQNWQDDRFYRIRFGIGVVVLGIVLGGIHLWRVRRSSEPPAPA